LGDIPRDRTPACVAAVPRTTSTPMVAYPPPAAVAAQLKLCTRYDQKKTADVPQPRTWRRGHARHDAQPITAANRHPIQARRRSGAGPNHLSGGASGRPGQSQVDRLQPRRRQLLEGSTGASRGDTILVPTGVIQQKRVGGDRSRARNRWPPAAGSNEVGGVRPSGI